LKPLKCSQLGPRPWGPEGEGARPDEFDASQFFNPNLDSFPRAHTATTGELITDHGDDKFFEEFQSRQSRATSGRDLQRLSAELIAQVGGAGQGGNSAGPPYPNITETSTQLAHKAGEAVASSREAKRRRDPPVASGQAGYESESDHETLPNEDEPGEFVKLPLGCALRANFTRPDHDRQDKFLPIDMLTRLITPGRIRNELENLRDPSDPRKRLISPDKLGYYTRQVCEVSDRTTSTHSSVSLSQPSSSRPASKPPRKRRTTRLKIFAILALLDRIDAIVDFIALDIHDQDLPFVLGEGTSPGSVRLYQNAQSGGKAIPLFDRKWRPSDLESFHINQWKFLAPYFRLSVERDDPILNYVLEKEIILPFIEEDSWKRGGFGQVSRVKIHHAHHNTCPDRVRLHFNRGQLTVAVL
jgi:hypothetical protein